LAAIKGLHKKTDKTVTENALDLAFLALLTETTPPYAPWSSRFGSEPPSVEDDVDVWRYAIVSCMPETTTMTTYY